MTEIFLPQSEQVRRTYTPSSRGLVDYCRLFGCEPQEFAAKDILDLGSGTECRFGRELLESFPESRVTCVDAQFLTSLIAPSAPHLTIVGSHFDQLLFDPESFDVVVSSHACSLYIEGEQSVLDSLHELCRVLRPQGSAYLAPFQFLTRSLSIPVPEPILSTTALRHDGVWYDTVLTDVLPATDEAVFQRMFASLPPDIDADLTHSPTLTPPYDALLILRKR